MKKETVIKYLKKYGKQPSTWIGIFAILTACGVKISDVEMNQMILLLVTLCGGGAIMMDEEKTKK